METPCWRWRGKSKYGTVWRDGRNHFVHRVSYELHYGPIPLGMFVCHHCDTPGCIRPTHLFLGTQQDNIRDAVAKGRHRNSKKTHCKNGHAFTEDNIYYEPKNGARHCRICKSAAMRRFYERRTQ